MTMTFLPMDGVVTVMFGKRIWSGLEPRILRLRPQSGDLAHVERESGGGSRATERLADAVVPTAIADGCRQAGREDRKYCAAVIVIAAQIGEVDVQGLDLRSGRFRERLECSERVADGRRVRQSRTRRGKHLCRRAVERGKGGKRIAPGRCKPGAERNHGRDVLGAQSFEEVGILRVAAHAGAGCERAVDADMTEVEVQRAHTCGGERRQQQQDYLGVAGTASFTEKLGAASCDVA